MKFLYVLLILAVVVPLRIWLFTRRRRRRAGQGELTGTRSGPKTMSSTQGHRAWGWHALEDAFGDVGVIAGREVRERVRGRIFRVGTLFILVAVGAAIVVPTLTSSSGPTKQTVAIVGGLSPQARGAVKTAASRDQDSVKFVAERSLAATKAGLRNGSLDLALVDSDEVLLDKPAASSSSPADANLVQDVAEYIGLLKAYQTAGISPSQAAEVAQAKPVPVKSLGGNSKAATTGTSVIGLVLLFIMLTQYCTWTLIGVMQEKTSRVVEVLLATVRPIQLLGGKVLGIGLVALGQAALVVGFALATAAAVGSDLLHGTEPLVLVCQLIWLLLGYAFYCWVYAAAGSMAERQDQVQTMAFPLSIPLLLGYIFSITVTGTGNPDIFFKILAYLPPTAPFCMSTLVALGQATWWEFVGSVVLSIAGTAGMAIFAARIYRRAVLRTGGRVHLRQVLRHTQAARKPGVP